MVLSRPYWQNVTGLTLTLSDVSAAALEAGRETLARNQLEGRVIASDVYSDISDRYDWIVANPPFHDGLNTSYSAAQRLISGAKARLNRSGKLCIVATPFTVSRSAGQHIWSA